MLVRRAVSLLSSVPLLVACAAVTTADGRRLGLASSDFRSYVEQVFREQNKTASELAFAIEDAARPGGADPPALTAAEDALLAACAGLNELATARRDDQRLGVRRSAGAARRAPDCERATLSARAALTTPAR
jgi:hypothetical protein